MAKRAVDMTVAGAGLLFSLPLLALLLLGSAVAFRANPLFVQHRLGRHGRLIPVPKVRSLPVETPSTADKHQLASVEVPPWGRFLRKSHLDELPQLWTVLVGHMSLIGPRPEMPHLTEGFSDEFAQLRESVRPGLTGLWQISTGSAGLISETPEFDTIYLTSWSPRLDMWVLAKTVRLYMPAGGTVSLNELPDWVELPEVRADDFAMTVVGG